MSGCLLGLALLGPAGACDSASKPHVDAAPAAQPKTPSESTTPAKPQHADGAGAVVSVDELRLSLPPGWQSITPKSQMRKAQFLVADGPAPLEVVVFRFPGGGGSATANIDRWKSQFTPPEGKTLDEVSKTESFGVRNLNATRLEVFGSFNDSMRPMAASPAGSGPSRMLAAIVEGSGDPFFFKLVGADAEVQNQSAAFDAMLKSIEVVGAAPSEQPGRPMAHDGGLPPGHPPSLPAGHPPTGAGAPKPGVGPHTQRPPN